MINNDWQQCLFSTHLLLSWYSVSESQYSQIIDVEVTHIHVMFIKMLKMNCNYQMSHCHWFYHHNAKINQYQINFTVIVCEKHHHIWLFLNKIMFVIDSNTNFISDTLIEHDVITFFKNDFYFCLHKSTLRHCSAYTLSHSLKWRRCFDQEVAFNDLWNVILIHTLNDFSLFVFCSVLHSSCIQLWSFTQKHCCKKCLWLWDWKTRYQSK